MVICIVALVVFSFLSIWSVRYRNLAKEAFGCVTNMVLLRPCDVNLESRIKTKMTSKLMIIPSLAKFFYKHFKILSWLFTITFFASLAYSAYSIYNIVVYGTCDPSSPSTCVVTKGIDIFAEIEKAIGCYEIQLFYIMIVIAALLLIYFSFSPATGKKEHQTKTAQ